MPKFGTEGLQKIMHQKGWFFYEKFRMIFIIPAVAGPNKIINSSVPPMTNIKLTLTDSEPLSIKINPTAAAISGIKNKV